MRFFTDETFLLLGGCGMVGQQIAHEIARELDPRLLILSGLTQEEVDRAVAGFRRDFPRVPVTGAVGDVFVRSEWNPHGQGQGKRLGRRELLESEEHRAALYEDVFLDRGRAYRGSELVRLISEYAPNVVIDSINTATAFSYQDVYTASDLARRTAGELKTAWRERADDEEIGGLIDSTGEALDAVLISQSVPQLVRHVLLINDAMREAKTRLYLKVGTTGTGGMGLNIPYTHSEDTPSATLMEKTAIAFAHTGLMYLMARTLGGPAVKELKPAAMIGFAGLNYQPIRVSGRGKIGVPGENVKLYRSRTEPLRAGEALRLRPADEAAKDYETLGDLNVVVVNTGENGFFTKGEFQAITHMRQMEFITPEEIARQVVLEVMGSSTGYDVIAAIDGASMNPTYRAGHLRHLAISELERLEEERDAPSVALGELGPPELGKLLWEAHLLRVACGNSLKAALSMSAGELSAAVLKVVREDERLRNTVVSVGLPILAPEGDAAGLALIRGPYIRIPEQKNRDTTDAFTPENVDAWAAKGWVDLRPGNMGRWLQRFAKMRHATERIRERGSSAFTRDAYLADEIEIGTVVGWIFNNEENFGYRIK